MVNNHFNTHLREIPARLVLAALLMLHALSAYAQLLEEVVVTAQKREESIQDIGIAVTAFTGEQITQLG